MLDKRQGFLAGLWHANSSHRYASMKELGHSKFQFRSNQQYIKTFHLLHHFLLQFNHGSEDSRFVAPGSWSRCLSCAR